MALKLVDPSSKILQAKADMVDDFSSAETQIIVSEMLKICGATQNGKDGKRTMVGLAAPQVGIAKRVVVVDAVANGVKPVGDNDFVVAINPTIKQKSRSRTRGREGCFSTGRVCGAVSRPNWVIVEYFDQKGRQHQKKFSGFTARIWQHEIDHLNGIRFPQRIRSPKYLHWVEKSEFDSYRKNWRNWPEHCSFEKWRGIANIGEKS